MEKGFLHMLVLALPFTFTQCARFRGPPGKPFNLSIIFWTSGVVTETLHNPS